MAVIATMVTRSGVTVRIHDDCIAPRGSAEEARIIEAQRRAAYKILKGAAEQCDQSQMRPA